MKVHELEKYGVQWFILKYDDSQCQVGLQSLSLSMQQEDICLRLVEGQPDIIQEKLLVEEEN